MALADIDRQLIERCLAGQAQAWEDFVDRFLGLMVHVVNHTAASRSVRLSASDREDLISEAFLAILDNDFAVLRNFRGRSSLATYLAVIARRVVVRQVLSSLSGISSATHQAYRGRPALQPTHDGAASAEQRIDDAEQVQQLLARLDGAEAQVVRLFHLQGKSYREISLETGMPENSIGPALSRARKKMRNSAVPAAPPADTDNDITPAAGQPAG